MSYISKREKVQTYIQKFILPALKQRDLDYEKVVDYISMETFSSHTMVRQILDNFIAIGKMERAKFFNPNTNQWEKTNSLTIPEAEIEDWLKGELEREKEIKKLDEVLKEAKDVKDS